MSGGNGASQPSGALCPSGSSWFRWFVVWGALVAMLTGACVSNDRRGASDAGVDTDATADGGDVGEDTGADSDGGGDSDATACTGDGGCDDGDPCTTDRCAAGACAHDVEPDCTVCDAASDCPAGSACEVATCGADRRCGVALASGCIPCDDGSACDDNNSCTVDVCSDGRCDFNARPCADGDACTDDSCDPAVGCVFEDTCGPPNVDFGGDLRLLEGTALHRQGAVSGRPGAELFAAVTWGDGSDERPLTITAFNTFELSYQYAVAGRYEAAVRVWDDAERTRTARIWVDVVNIPPAITLDEIAVPTEGGELIGSARVDDPGAVVLDVSVDFGDGPERVAVDDNGSFSFAHRYPDDGVFPVSVSATDHNETTRVAFEVTVDNVAPLVQNPGGQSVREGEAQVLALGITDPGDDTFTATVRYAEGAQPVAAALSEAGDAVLVPLDYPDDGLHTVWVEVRDDDHGGSGVSFEVVVENVAPAVAAVENQAVDEGQPMIASVAVTELGDDTLRAELSPGDGPAVPVTIDDEGVARVAYAYQDDGEFKAVLTVWDDDNASGSASFDVAVRNVAPGADLGGPGSADEGAPWVREGQLQDPGARDTLQAWVTWGTGEDEEPLPIGPNRSYRLDKTYPQDGQYRVSVRVRDDSGDETVEHVTVAVANVAPQVSCGSHAVLSEGGTLRRICTVADPGQDDAAEGIVLWGDGSSEALVIEDNGTFVLEHLYPEEGTYPVSVLVDDRQDLTTVDFDVAVGNAPPLVDVGSTAVLVEGGRLLRIGTVLDAGTQDDFNATVDYGLGAGPVPLDIAGDRTFVLDVRYPQDGLYEVAVVVTDSDDENGSATLRVQVDNGAPSVVTQEALAGAEGELLALHIAVDDPGVRDTVGGTIDWGDGSPITPWAGGAVPQGHDVTHRYADDGDYVVTVRASDDDNGSSRAVVPVVVHNVAPEIDPLGDRGLDEGASLSFNLAFSDPGADTWAAEITFGDGTAPETLEGLSPGAPVVVKHTYVDNGGFTVRITLSDGAAAAVASFTATVDNVAPRVTFDPVGAVAEGGAVTVTGQVEDPGSEPSLAASVRWGDGGDAQPITVGSDRRFSLTHTYIDDSSAQQEGVFRAVVTVDDGTVEAAGAVDIAVTNVAPTLKAPSTVHSFEGQDAAAVVTFTDPGAEADGFTATVDYGQGPEPVAAQTNGRVSLTHRFDDDGTYPVIVTVHDGEDLGEARFDVVVANVAPQINVGGDVTIGAGERFDRAIHVVDPGASDTFTATVSWNTGDLGVSVPVDGRVLVLSHDYAVSGPHEVTVTVADDHNAQASGSFVVTVSNNAPVVHVGGDAVLTEGSTLQRVVTFTDEGVGPWSATARYGAGATPVALDVDQAARSVTLQKRFANQGSHAVTVTVTDPSAVMGSASFDVDVSNVTPTLDIPSVGVALEGTEWIQQGSVSDPGLDDVLTVSADYGEGPQDVVVTDGAIRLAHTWADNGSRDVAVTASDDVDSTARFIAIDVQNVSPVIGGIVPPVLDEGQRWQANVVFSDPGADTWTLEADYEGTGDATVTALSNRSFSIDRPYGRPGVYPAHLTVRDDDGGEGSAAVPVTVHNVAPWFTGQIGDVEIAEGAPAIVIAQFADAGSDVNHTVRFAWTGPEGAWTPWVPQTSTVIVAQHTYPQEGDFIVEVEVADAFGGTVGQSFEVRVHNVPPQIALPAVARTDVDGVFELSGTFTDPGADTWTIDVDWGDGSPAYTAFSSGTIDATHTYLEAGDRVVTVEVSDGTATSRVHIDLSVFLLDCVGLPLEGSSVWMGGAASGPWSWAEAQNWDPIAVPGASADVVVCGGNAHYPSLTGNAAASSLTMADDAVVDTAGRELTVAGNVIGGTVSGSGLLEMTQDQSELAATVPNVNLTGWVRVADGVTITGDVEVLQGGLLDVEGALNVHGGLTVRAEAGNAGVILDDGDDVLNIAGDLLLLANSGSGQARGGWSEGRLHLGGGLTAIDVEDDGARSAFRPAADVVVRFGGTSPQAVSIKPTRGEVSALPSVEVASGADVLLASSFVTVLGTLTVEDGGHLGGGHARFVSALPDEEAQGYTVGKTSIAGEVAMSSSLDLHEGEQHVAVERGARLMVGPYVLSMSGSLLVQRSTAYDGLDMQHSAGLVDVGRDATFEGTPAKSTQEPAGAPRHRDDDVISAAETALSHGTIRVAADFEQIVAQGGDAVPPFAPSGTRVSLTGDGVHTVTFSGPDVNHFADLVLKPGATVTLLSDVRVAGRLSSAVDASGNTGEVNAAEVQVIGGGHELRVTEVDLVSATLSRVLLAIAPGAGGTARLEEVTFSDYAPGDRQVGFLASGGDFTWSKLVFDSLPSTEGAYIEGQHEGGSGGNTTLVVEASVPHHGTPWCRVGDKFNLRWGDAGTADTDGDLLLDVQEHDAGTDPRDPDTDGDSFFDGTETQLLFDPDDADSVPFSLAAPLTLALPGTPWRGAVGLVDSGQTVDVVVTLPESKELVAIYGGTGGVTMQSTALEATPWDVIMAGPAAHAVLVTLEGGTVVRLSEVAGTPGLLGGPPNGGMPVGHEPTAIAVGFVNDDANRDFVTVATMEDAVSVGIKGSGAPPYSVVQVPSAGGAPGAVCVGQLVDTGSGFAVASETDGMVRVFGADKSDEGAHGFTPEQSLSVDAPVSLWCGDVVGSVLHDIVVGRADGHVTIFEQRISGGTTIYDRLDDIIPPVGSPLTQIAVGDINDDARLDLFFVAPELDGVLIAIASPKARHIQDFVPHFVGGLANAGEVDVMFADLSGGGQGALITVNADDDSISIITHE